MIKKDELSKKYVTDDGAEFATRQEARDYERSRMLDLTTEEENSDAKNLNITFNELLDVFLEEKRVRIRQTTFISYELLTRRFLRPAFGDMKLREITVADIRRWQNRIIQLDYKPQYIRKIDSIMVTVMNYAMRFYGLPSNPALMAGSIGEWKSTNTSFWKKEDYEQFRKFISDETIRVAFDLLFWTGMRVGELLALCTKDIEFEERAVNINKTYRRYHRVDYITPPKTKKSIRKVYLHTALLEELEAYIAGRRPKIEERLFNFTIEALHGPLKRGIQASGVRKIKLHDLRHSHASLLADMNIEPLLISERLGHEKVETTLNIYSHVYPDKQRALANRLDDIVG